MVSFRMACGICSRPGQRGKRKDIYSTAVRWMKCQGARMDTHMLYQTV